jgi:hypothetical protein
MDREPGILISSNGNVRHCDVLTFGLDLTLDSTTSCSSTKHKKSKSKQTTMTDDGAAAHYLVE